VTWLAPFAARMRPEQEKRHGEASAKDVDKAVQDAAKGLA
jgi:hypothetical protein